MSQDATKRKKALEKRGSTSLPSAWKYSYPFAFQDADQLWRELFVVGRFICVHGYMVGYI
jgi:hypothetical protein